MNSTHGKNKRIVADSMGEMEVDADAFYGAQTQRAIDNFKISWQRFDPIFIESLAALKASCAMANHSNKLLSQKVAKSIYSSALEIHKNIKDYYCLLYTSDAADDW